MMIDMQTENDQAEGLRLQQLGKDWVGAIADSALERLEQLCQPDLTGRLLLPRRFVTVNKAADLLAEYHDWFDGYTSTRLEMSRIATVGEKLGISYGFLLQDRSDWYRIEQQLYCTLTDSRVQQLNLVCSGFQPVAGNSPAAPIAVSPESLDGPIPNGLLEFMSQERDTTSTCAVLTPMIRSKLGDLRSGEVLEVRVNDPDARGDVEAWSRLSGNQLLKVVEQKGQMLQFFLKKK